MPDSSSETGGSSGPAVGRFAPTPSGPLHAGSMAAALGSWLDARARGGRWLVRMEDVDTPRCRPGAAERILQQLSACGLVPDAPPWWQSQRSAAYQDALDGLLMRGLAYGCACTRQEIDAAARRAGLAHQRHAERVYPGTCRPSRAGLGGRHARARRLLCQQPDGSDVIIDWLDRRLGAQRQNVTQAVGDFVLQRADGCWSYQLAVVVDDAAQGVTDVVRGEDLADNTPRQIWLQRCLGVPTPRYLHLPLVRAADGEKLSKQHGAPPIDEAQPLAVLAQAATSLGLRVPMAGTVPEWLAAAVRAWPGFGAMA